MFDNRDDKDKNELGSQNTQNDGQNNNYGSYDSRNGNYYGGNYQPPNNGGYPPPQWNDNPTPQKSGNGKGFAILTIFLMFVLTCTLFFLIGRGFMADGLPSGSPNDELVDVDVDESGKDAQSGQNETPSGDNVLDQGEQKNDQIQNGDFKLEAVPAEEHYRLANVYEMTKETVVEITTESVETGSFMQQYVTTGAGSGVIITKDGYIVTNNHVIEGATKITVTLRNGEKYSAALIGTDVKTDLAVLKIEANELSAATLGLSKDMLVGEEILIIGNPLGSLGGSASNGIVSATAREISIEGQLMTLIQTNAAVNPGNSGGAMFNLAGQLVGIVNAKYTDEAVEGIGFAIPIDTAKPVIEDLTNYGYVKGRPNLGLTIEYGTSRYISSVGATNWITVVEAGSDGEKAGLKEMDQIISVNGNTFTSAEPLNAYLDKLKVGEKVTFSIRRYTAVSSSFWGTQYSSEDLTFEMVLTEYEK